MKLKKGLENSSSEPWYDLSDGGYLKPEEIVHHKGIKYPLVSIENKQDDRPENLRLFPNRSKHGKFHQSLSSLNSLRINTSL